MIISGRKLVRVLGIDPGLASIGWGVVERDGARIVYIAHGCFTTSPKSDIGERLSKIRDCTKNILDQFKPDEVSMEALYFAKNVTSAFAVSEARGIIRLVSYDYGLNISEYSPVDIKKTATGSGRAEKIDVQNFVKIVLGLSDIPRPDHAADALAVALCHCTNKLWN